MRIHTLKWLTHSKLPHTVGAFALNWFFPPCDIAAGSLAVPCFLKLSPLSYCDLMSEFQPMALTSPSLYSAHLLHIVSQKFYVFFPLSGDQCWVPLSSQWRAIVIWWCLQFYLKPIKSKLLGTDLGIYIFLKSWKVFQILSWWFYSVSSAVISITSTTISNILNNPYIYDS